MYNVRIFSSKISNDSAFFLTTFRTIQSVYIYSLYFCRKRLRKDFGSFRYSTRGNEQKDLNKHGSKKHLFRSYETFLSVRHYLYDICSQYALRSFRHTLFDTFSHRSASTSIHGVCLISWQDFSIRRIDSFNEATGLPYTLYFYAPNKYFYTQLRM